MVEQLKEIKSDLLVIGAGMAGMSAALFAANRGINIIQCGSTSGLVFASGMLDLLGIYPVAENRKWDNPWQAIEYLGTREPNHPYTRLSLETVKQAVEEILSFFKVNGFEYRNRENLNSLLPTGQGTLKPSYAIPFSMWNGVEAFSEKKRCLLIDFEGMKEFSALQIVENLKQQWPELRHIRLKFPGLTKGGEVHPEQMARALENEQNRKLLAADIKQHLRDEESVGMPAVLGIYHADSVFKGLEKDLGVSLFEIPTPAVSVSGLRIKEFFERYLPEKGVRQLQNSKVINVQSVGNDRFEVLVNQHNNTLRIITKGIILSSGRFLGGGLVAERNQIREKVFNLPVVQPESREEWHRVDFFDQRGNPVNRSGIEVDERFRPLDSSGQPFNQNLFAAGSILAHQDWIREKSGSGIAIASAFAAVQAFVKSNIPQQAG